MERRSDKKEVTKRLVLLTGTCPVQLRPHLTAAYGIKDPVDLIAAPHTHRPNIRYTFHAVAEFDVERTVDYMEQFTFSSDDEVAIVFVEQIKHTTDVAERYQARMGGELPYTCHGGDNAPTFNYPQWRASTRRSRFIIATPALFHGVDHPSVRVALFAYVPNTLLELQQGAGRLARALPMGELVVLVPNKMPWYEEYADKRLIHKMAHGNKSETSECRRYVMSAELDHQPRHCSALGGKVELCDNCQKIFVGHYPISPPLVSLNNSHSGLSCPSYSIHSPR